MFFRQPVPTWRDHACEWGTAMVARNPARINPRGIATLPPSGAWARLAARPSAPRTGRTDNGCPAGRARPPGGAAPRTPAGRSARCRSWSRRTARHASPTALAGRFAVDGEAVVHRDDLDLAGGEVLHRMVRAVVALVHLHASWRRPRAPASGGRGRCRRSACRCRAAAADGRARRIRRSPPDRPGRWRGTRRPASAPGCPRRWRWPAPP